MQCVGFGACVGRMYSHCQFMSASQHVHDELGRARSHAIPLGRCAMKVFVHCRD